MKHILFIFTVALISCQSFSKSDKPEDFYGDEKMAQIMADLYLYEGVISANRMSLKKNGILATNLIYHKHATDSATFTKNFHYYTDREGEYLLLMDRVQEILEQEQDSVAKRQEEVNLEPEKFKSLPKKDSIPLTKKEIRQDLL